MKKGFIFGIIALAVLFSLLPSGCGTKKASYVGKSFESENKAAEGETKAEAEYKSLIEKYVSKPGESYMAHDYMLTNELESRYSAEAWTDDNGNLRLPFDPDDFKETESSVYEGKTYKHTVYTVYPAESYYIPDEVAANASTKELADVFMSYIYNGGAVPMALYRPGVSSYYEQEFVNMLSRSNILEETLRRDDFAEAYYEIYMAESNAMPTQKDGEEVFADDVQTDESSKLCSATSNKICTLDVVEVMLAQPEAYEQLAQEHREALVRRVLEREKRGENGEIYISGGVSESHEYWTTFFACIAGELYLPAEMTEGSNSFCNGITGDIDRYNNPWLDTINRMKFTEEEQKILEKYFVKR